MSMSISGWPGRDGGGDIPYVDMVSEIAPDTPKPDPEAIGYIKVLNGLLEARTQENAELRVEVERLRKAASEGVSELLGIVAEKEREVERLRWFYDNMRDADRRNLQMLYEAARERED